MITATAQVSTKYQVVIPKEVREVLDVHPGERLLFLVDGDVVYMRPEPADYTAALRGLHRDVWSGLDAGGMASWLEAERDAWR